MATCEMILFSVPLSQVPVRRRQHLPPGVLLLPSQLLLRAVLQQNSLPHGPAAASAHGKW